MADTHLSDFMYEHKEDEEETEEKAEEEEGKEEMEGRRRDECLFCGNGEEQQDSRIGGGGRKPAISRLNLRHSIQNCGHESGCIPAPI